MGRFLTFRPLTGYSKVMSLPYHLQYLEYLLNTPPGDLSDYFPQSASGTLKPRKGEGFFCAMRGICYVGNMDGTMVPIEADNLEEISGNYFDARKFSTLVDAIEHGGIVLEPGYADLTYNDGVLGAQIQDGNHRTLAAIAAGASMSWVMISDRTRQDINAGLDDKLYKAIRAAQKSSGVPLLKKRTLTKIKSTPAFEALRAAEAESLEIRVAQHGYYQSMLKRFGLVKRPAASEYEQMERSELFWLMRVQELIEVQGDDWLYALEEELNTKKANARVLRRQDLNLPDLRRAAGLQHGERLDPVTMMVVR